MWRSFFSTMSYHGEIVHYFTCTKFPGNRRCFGQLKKESRHKQTWSHSPATDFLANMSSKSWAFFYASNKQSEWITIIPTRLLLIFHVHMCIHMSSTLHSSKFFASFFTRKTKIIILSKLYILNWIIWLMPYHDTIPNLKQKKETVLNSKVGNKHIRTCLSQGCGEVGSSQWLCLKIRAWEQ
jgi:hypothetical protein